MPTFDTLTEAIDALRRDGYTHDYNLKDDHLHRPHDNVQLHPADFDIVQVFRFEGMTDPDDESVLYAVESRDGHKGILVDAYGAYAESISHEMAGKLRYDPSR
ncbi:hypothetical protein GCM10027578_40740 [Spirosoma luteolum]